MSGLVERCAETARGAGIGSVYGEPVELNGITVIPVAVAFKSVGGGGGRGTRGPEAGTGEGGGGVIAVAPVGAYVRDIRGLRFEPNIIALLAVGIPFVWVSGRVLTRLLKIAKR